MFYIGPATNRFAGCKHRQRSRALRVQLTGFVSARPLDEIEVNLEKKEERAITRKIQQSLGKILIRYGFSHTKPSFYIRENYPWYDVIHLHKFSFAPSFRVHIALRHIYDSFGAIAFNGPDSERIIIYRNNFDASEDSISHCIQVIEDFIQEIGFEWFKKTHKISDAEICKELKITLFENDEIRNTTLTLLGLASTSSNKI